MGELCVIKFISMHDFTNLKIWMKSIDLAEFIYRITEDFPEKEKFGIISQMRRCSISISSNIAEGCGRNGDKELLHFLNIANGSTCELHSQVILSERLMFINDDKLNSILSKINEIKNMNYKLQQSIKNRYK